MNACMFFNTLTKEKHSKLVMGSVFSMEIIEMFLDCFDFEVL